MKRLIALLLSIITALFQNIEYTPATKDTNEFAHGSYYVITDNEEPDFRDIYGGVNDKRKLANACNTAHRDPYIRTVLTYPDGNYSTNSADMGSWLIKDEEKLWNDLDVTNNAVKIGTDGSIILAPYLCELVRPDCHDATKLSFTFKHDDDEFLVNITGMKCWWCDTSKLNPDVVDEDGNEIYYHTWTTLSDTTFKQGAILGVCSNETLVEVFDKKTNDRISLRDMYARCAKVTS